MQLGRLCFVTPPSLAPVISCYEPLGGNDLPLEATSHYTVHIGIVGPRDEVRSAKGISS